MAEEIISTNDKQVKSGLKGLAKAIFDKTRISIESAAQSVIPSIPKYLANVTEQITTGPAENISEILKKLDYTVVRLGIDLGKYNKGIQDFSDMWRDKQIESDKEVAQLRKQNIVSEVNRFNEVNILSRREIQERYRELDVVNIKLEQEKKLFEIEKKQLQTKRQTLAKENELKNSLSNRTKKIQQLEEDRKPKIDALGPEAENRKPSLLGRITSKVGNFGRGASNFGERYIPAPLMNVISTFTQSLTAPIDMMKDFGGQLFEIAKPLRLVSDPLRKMGRGLMNISQNLFDFDLSFGKTRKSIGDFGSLIGKKVTGQFTKLGKGLQIFGLGLLRIITNPIFLAIAGIAAAGGLIAFLLSKFGKPGGPGSAGDIRGETYLPDDNFGDQSTESARDPKDPRAPFAYKGQVIQPDDPNYDKYKEELGLPPTPKQDDISSKKVFPQNQTDTIPTEENSILKELLNNKGGMSIEEFRDQLNQAPLDQFASKTELTNNQPITNIKSGTSQISTGITGSRNEDFWFNKGLAV